MGIYAWADLEGFKNNLKNERRPCRGTEEPPPPPPLLFFMSKKIYYQIFRNTRVNVFFSRHGEKKKKAFILPSGIHISEVSKPPPDKGGILTRLTSPSLTCTHSSRPQRDTSGMLVENPPAGGVSSLQSMPPPSPLPPHPLLPGLLPRLFPL